MAKARNYEERLYRAIGIAKYFYENEGKTAQDAADEFEISRTTVRKDINYLAGRLFAREFADDPKKELQIYRWYKKTKQVMEKNHYRRPNRNK